MSPRATVAGYFKLLLSSSTSLVLLLHYPPHPGLLLVHGELLLLDGLQLVPEVELGRLLLQLGELVLILGHLLQGRLDAAMRYALASECVIAKYQLTIFP